MVQKRVGPKEKERKSAKRGEKRETITNKITRKAARDPHMNHFEQQQLTD